MANYKKGLVLLSPDVQLQADMEVFISLGLQATRVVLRGEPISRNELSAMELNPNNFETETQYQAFRKVMKGHHERGELYVREEV